VTVEIIGLALASTIRPTSLAAVYALLAADSPRRLMGVYVAVGSAFTVAFGLLVIWAFNGISINAGTDHTKGIAEMAGGLVVLAFALGVLTGRLGGRHADDAPNPDGRWKQLLQHRLTVRTAAVAGPATHIPGLFYLVALNLIVAHRAHVVGGLLEVLIYNAIWFAIRAPFAICVADPAAARDAVGAIQGWTRGHSRAIVLVVSFGIGTALIVRGALAL
jgi:Sap, sulfolipid-1-addressing protein